MVSEAIFPTNRGYICIEKWSQILVSGIGSAHSESEEKAPFKLKNILWTSILINRTPGTSFIPFLVILCAFFGEKIVLWILTVSGARANRVEIEAR